MLRGGVGIFLHALFVVMGLAFFTPIYAQSQDTLIVIKKPVLVTGYRNETAENSVLSIKKIETDSLSALGNYNLSELISHEPGVDQLFSGIGISKPVIRGLYGNRITVLIAGMRFDNQQWQDEHGMGLSDFGISGVELIKGPLGVLYGSEALGGVINLVEENKPPLGYSIQDYSISLNSNTLGGKLNYGVRKNNGKNWWRIRVAVENNADYTDGNNNRVLNSRFDGYYGKASYGFIKGNWKSVNNYMLSFNRYGFIFNDIYTFIEPDERWSRTLNKNPAHYVFLNLLNSENAIQLKGSKLDWNIGLQSNERMENEGGGAISLNMHLFTIQQLVKWQKQWNKWSLTLSNLASYENNTNFGARKIVPDAHMEESNVSAMGHYKLNEVLAFSLGAGMGEKFIKTLETKYVNDDSKTIKPFEKFGIYGNGMAGFVVNYNEYFVLKINVSSGVRMPNLAELSSDGLHEGIFTYEIGNPNLKNEIMMAINADLSGEISKFTYGISPFYNHIQNYVYLAPTAESWFGFPIYRYQQGNTIQYGFEAYLGLEILPELKLNTSYSQMTSQLNNNEYTPFIPANNINFSYNGTFKIAKNIPLNAFVKESYFGAQNQTAPYELATPAYHLLSAGVNTKWIKGTYLWQIGVSGNNLLNTTYYSHMSRFKSLGLFNPGRNFMLNLKLMKVHAKK